MLRKVLPVILATVITMVLTTLLQPLSFVLQAARAESQPGQMQTTDIATCQSFPQTGLEVCGRFLSYWYKYGGLFEFGYPVSYAFRETSEADGNQYTVQYFERAVFELHPQNQPPYDILLSQLGRDKYRRKYPLGSSSTSTAGIGPVTPVQIGDPQPDLNVRKQLRPGVYVKLIRQEQAAITGLYTGNCGLEMTWVLQIENMSRAPFVANLDASNLRMLDSRGNSYHPINQCPGVLVDFYSGSFTQPARLLPGDILKGTIDFQFGNIPASASYLQLNVTISGAPAEFRYALP